MPTDPPAPPSSTSTIGPIIGVVDGSDAAPGEVGEFLATENSLHYSAYPNNTIAAINMLNMPPGDWDLTVFASFSTMIGGAAFFLNPLPTGMSNSMFGLLSTVGNVLGLEVEVLIDGTAARGSFAVPTLLVFEMQIFMSGDSALTTAGTVTMRMEARRRR